VVPELSSGEGREWLNSVTHETSCGMGVHSEEERNEQVMCVPESLKRLLTDLCVSSRVHEKHAQEHDMPRDATSFGVVDLNGCNFSDLSLLDVEEADSISRISVIKNIETHLT
jgi:hypothetical protein